MNLSIPENFDPTTYYRFTEILKICKNFLEQKPKKSIRLLDIGCGNGLLMKYLKDNLVDVNFELYGIDICDYKKDLEFKFIVLDAEKEIPFDNDFFDLILACEIIEHIRETDLLLKEIYRISKNNSLIIISTPNLASFFNRFLLLFGFQPYHSEVSNVESGFGLSIVYKILGRELIGNKTAGHLRLFTYRAFKDMINYYGFNLEKFYPVYLSSYRKDNKRIKIIKIIYFMEKIISLSFPKLSNGFIFCLSKKSNHGVV